MKRHDWLPAGVRLERTGRSGHYQVVIEETNEVLRLGSGIPVQISHSPSDHRTQRNELARIRRALRERRG